MLLFSTKNDSKVWTSRVIFSHENVSQDRHVQQSEDRNTSIGVYMSSERMVTKAPVA